MARDLTTITANANVNFIRATQAQIDSALSANKSDWAQGTFYLTKDTDRLYFAQSSSELVSLNQFIHFWTGSNLPNSTSYANLANNDIFYWTNQNALIICTNAQEGTFTQLNPDTFLKASSSAIGVTSNNNNNSAKVSLTVEDTYGAGTAVKDRVTGDMTITGGENIRVAVSGNTITLTGTNTNDNTTYSLSPVSEANNTVKLRLTETPHTLGVAGTPVNHDINITGQNINIATDGTDITLTANAGVNGLTKTFDEKNGALTTKIQFDGNTLAQNTITPIIAYGENDSETFKGGTATLNVYNKTQVDNLIAAAKAQADALTYKGIISDTDAAAKLVIRDAAASIGVSIGDVYKASTEITNNNLSGNKKAKTGDLIIATGEYINGVETITGWEVVPSGDDQLISVDQNTAKTVKIMDNNTTLGGIAVDGSTTEYGTIGVTQTVSGGIKTLTVAHGAAGATATTLGGNSGTPYTAATNDTKLDAGQVVYGANATSTQNATTIEIPTISGISYDSAGHITGITTATYRVLDSHINLNSFVAGVSADQNQAMISHTLTIDGQSLPPQLTPTVYLKAKDITGSLQITANGTNTIELGLVWGEFA